MDITNTLEATSSIDVSNTSTDALVYVPLPWDNSVRSSVQWYDEVFERSIFSRTSDITSFPDLS